MRVIIMYQMYNFYVKKSRKFYGTRKTKRFA